MPKEIKVGDWVWFDNHPYALSREYPPEIILGQVTMIYGPYIKDRYVIRGSKADYLYCDQLSLHRPEQLCLE